MRRTTVGGILAVSLVMTAVALAQGFKVYPGAKPYTPPDSEQTREAAKMMPAGMQQTIYLTDDSYDKVVAFYKGIGKESVMPYMNKSTKLPNGQELQQTYFILDGASGLANSKNWAKVQRPYIGWVDMKGGTPEYKDIRDVTAIVVVEKK